MKEQEEKQTSIEYLLDIIEDLLFYTSVYSAKYLIHEYRLIGEHNIDDAVDYFKMNSEDAETILQPNKAAESSSLLEDKN